MINEQAVKNVLLIGIGGTYNYGCEAIVRGTVAILKAYNPEIYISYASYNYDDDVRRLAGCEVKILPRPHRKKWTIHNIVRKVLSYAGISYTLPYDSMEWVSSFDTVFSIGGDIYTLQANGAYNRSLPLFMERCQSAGLKYVLWGASVGKFESNPHALRFFKRHLPKIDLIVAREQNTVDYLRSLGCIHNVCMAPDPAYFVPCPAIGSPADDKTVVGINLSPVSAMYEYGDMSMAIARQSRAIAGLIERMHCSVLLIPHVLAPNANDNDLSYLHEIKKAIPIQFQDGVSVIDTDPQFIGMKRYLSQCNYVIAARMHCAINAITTGVPTLFLSYSEKAKGMVRYVYGADDAVMSLKNFEDTEQVVSKLDVLPVSVNTDKIRNFDFQSVLDSL